MFGYGKRCETRPEFYPVTTPIHTDAIRGTPLPPALSEAQVAVIYLPLMHFDIREGTTRIFGTIERGQAADSDAGQCRRAGLAS